MEEERVRDGQCVAEKEDVEQKKAVRPLSWLRRGAELWHGATTKCATFIWEGNLDLRPITEQLKRYSAAAAAEALKIRLRRPAARCISEPHAIAHIAIH